MSQTAAILAHLKRGHNIGPLIALRYYGTFRLAARIRELRERGFKIRTEIRETRPGRRVAFYSLESPR